MAEIGNDVINGLPKTTDEQGHEIFQLSVPGGQRVSFYDIRESHLDKPMTNFALQYNQEMEYIADGIFPKLPVQKESDKYFYFDARDVTSLPTSVVRGDTAETAQIFTTASNTTYTCEELALGMLISQRQIDNADTPLDPIADAVYVLTQLLGLYREKRLATLLFSTTNFSSYYSALTTTSQWSDMENSSPMGNQITAKQSVQKVALQRPNTLIVGEEVWDKVKRHPELLAYISPGGTVNAPSLMSKDAAAQCFEVNRLLVGGSVYNSANKGQTLSSAYVWGKYALFAYVSPRVGQKIMTLGMHFTYQNFQVSRYWVPARKSWFVEVSIIDIPKLTAAGAGYLFSTVVA